MFEALWKLSLIRSTDPRRSRIRGKIVFACLTCPADTFRAPVPNPDPEYLPFPASSPSNVTIYHIGRSLRPSPLDPYESDTVALWRSVLPNVFESRESSNTISQVGPTAESSDRRMLLIADNCSLAHGIRYRLAGRPVRINSRRSRLSYSGVFNVDRGLSSPRGRRSSPRHHLSADKKQHIYVRQR